MNRTSTTTGFLLAAWIVFSLATAATAQTVYWTERGHPGEKRTGNQAHQPLQQRT
jgi:hypothetical protein